LLKSAIKSIKMDNNKNNQRKWISTKTLLT
jgi:hypothetical protein